MEEVHLMLIYNLWIWFNWKTLKEIEFDCKKIKKVYDLIQKFQDAIWVAKLPWAKSVWNEYGFLINIRCKICTKIMGKEKQLIL
jgi:hypothetical protein